MLQRLSVLKRRSDAPIWKADTTEHNPEWRHNVSESSASGVVPRSLEQNAHKLSKEENEMGKLRTVAAAPCALIGRPSSLEVYEEIVFDVKPTCVGEGKTKGGW